MSTIFIGEAARMCGKQFIGNTHAIKTAKGVVVSEVEIVYARDARAGRIVWWYWKRAMWTEASSGCHK